MSEFIELYREKNRIKHKLRILRKKADPEVYWALKAKERELNDRLNQIIADDTRIQNQVPMGNTDRIQGEDPGRHKDSHYPSR